MTFAALQHKRPVRSIDTLSSLDELTTAWQALQLRSPDATVFSTWEWNKLAAQHFCRHSSLRVMLFEQDGPRALLPLVYRQAHTLRSLVFLGTGGLNYSPADYQDWLCADGSEDIAIDAFADELASKDDWDLLWLQELPQHSRLLHRLPLIAEKHGWRYVQFGDDDAFHIDLPETWEGYVETLSSNTRTNMARKARKLGREAGGRFETADEDTVGQLMQTLFDLHQRRWAVAGEPGIFNTDEMRAFHLDLARHFQEAGMDGQGIRHAIEHGMTREDLLRGDGAYKQKYSPASTVNQDVRVFRTGAAYLRYKAYKGVRNFVRRLAGRKDVVRWRVEAGRTSGED
jgi:CelD/BcsL family acetyltransferase involved in cellulose biosynthesis